MACTALEVPIDELVTLSAAPVLEAVFVFEIVRSEPVVSEVELSVNAF